MKECREHEAVSGQGPIDIHGANFEEGMPSWYQRRADTEGEVEARSVLGKGNAKAVGPHQLADLAQ